MRFKITSILLLFTISLFSQITYDNKTIPNKLITAKPVKYTIKVNTIQPLGFLVNNKAGKGFDLQYEFPINTKEKSKYSSINIRGFYSFLYFKNVNKGTLTVSYEKTGGSVMIKKYKNADRSEVFFGFSITAASLVYRDRYERFDRDEVLHGFFGGIGVAYGKTYRYGKWSIEPVLQIGIGLSSINAGDIANLKKSRTNNNRTTGGVDDLGDLGGGYFAASARADEFARKFLKTFSNSYFAVNVGYSL